MAIPASVLPFKKILSKKHHGISVAENTEVGAEFKIMLSFIIIAPHKLNIIIQ